MEIFDLFLYRINLVIFFLPSPARSLTLLLSPPFLSPSLAKYIYRDIGSFVMGLGTRFAFYPFVSTSIAEMEIQEVARTSKLPFTTRPKCLNLQIRRPE